MAIFTDAQHEVLRNSIWGVESGGQVYGNCKYDSFVEAFHISDEETGITIGAAQNHAGNAKKLLNKILSEYPKTFRKYDTAGIESDLAQDWTNYRVSASSDKAKAIVAIISSDDGKTVQNEMFKENMESIASTILTDYKITLAAPLMMACNIAHLGGIAPTQRILSRATAFTLDAIMTSLKKDQDDTSNNNQVGDAIYWSRHQCVYTWLKSKIGNTALGTATTTTTTSTSSDSESEISKIYDVAILEVGYLEKKTNAYLDDKTKNAGYNNYTKYWRDVRQTGMMSYFGYSANTDFAGGSDWPYCACGVFWIFYKALGLERAKKLLLHDQYAFINCNTLASLSRSAGQLYNTPKVGDVALFYKGNYNYYHTEWVWKVDDSKFYTIGFNTSGASTVIANGGGCCSKSYNISGTSVSFHRPKWDSTTEATTTHVSSNATEGVSVTSIKYGSNGSAVKTLQEKLVALGYSVGSCGADGIFGNDTLEAVKAYQKANGLTVDGIVGEETTKSLNEKYAALSETSSKTSTTKSTDPTERDVLFKGKCLGNGVNVRCWAGTEYGNISSWPTLDKGYPVEVLDYTKKDTSGKDWYFVRIKSKYHGFVRSDYIGKA